MWWSVATLTTVGYGDVYPHTPLRKVLAGATAMIGIGLIAMPTGILASALRKSTADETNQPHTRRQGLADSPEALKKAAIQAEHRYTRQSFSEQAARHHARPTLRDAPHSVAVVDPSLRGRAGWLRRSASDQCADRQPGSRQGIQ